MSKYIIKKRIKKKIKITTERANSIIYKIVSNFFFEIMIYLVVIGNILLMGWDVKDQTDEQYARITIINYICLLIYNFELVLKLIGYGPKIYFSDSYNTMDAFTIFF
jgi:hypothetical protein